MARTMGPRALSSNSLRPVNPIYRVKAARSSIMPRILGTVALKLAVIGGIAHQAFPQSTSPSSNPFPADTPGGSVAATDLRVARTQSRWLAVSDHPSERIAPTLDPLRRAVSGPCGEPDWTRLCPGRRRIRFNPAALGHLLTAHEMAGVSRGHTGFASLLQSSCIECTALPKHLGHSGGVCSAGQFDRRLD